MAIKICLDAGHYGKFNRSPAVKEYYESEMNWKLHLLIKKELEAYGIEVITTRSQQENDKSLLARGQMAKGCDLFLSIHSNACDDESVDRPVVIVPYSGVADNIGKVLGQCIQDTMGVSEYQLFKKKSEKGDWDWYTVIQGAISVGVPGIILEHSFHTNTKATKWLLQDRNLERLAKTEAAAIAAHYGVATDGDQEAEANTEDNVLVKLPILRNGSKGDTVKAMQILLIGYKYSCGAYGADGQFGQATEYALRRFKKEHNLEVDGICDPATWAELLGLV